MNSQIFIHFYPVWLITLNCGFTITRTMWTAEQTEQYWSRWPTCLLFCVNETVAGSVKEYFRISFQCFCLQILLKPDDLSTKAAETKTRLSFFQRSSASEDLISDILPSDEGGAASRIMLKLFFSGVWACVLYLKHDSPAVCHHVIFYCILTAVWP